MYARLGFSNLNERRSAQGIKMVVETATAASLWKAKKAAL